MPLPLAVDRDLESLLQTMLKQHFAAQPERVTRLERLVCAIVRGPLEIHTPGAPIAEVASDVVRLARELEKQMDTMPQEVTP